MLTKSTFDQASQSIMKYGRPLDKCIFQRYFHNGSDEAVINELKKFQNEDGGFGHGIESDFRLPHSSPMATSVGLRLLSEVDGAEEAKEMIKRAIAYLEASFDRERNGWFVASQEINVFPHAPWWHFNEASGMTIIDRNWGNPSAEIVAYLYRYRQYVKGLDVDALVHYAMNHLENKQEINSENQIYCYIKLYQALPEALQRRMEKTIVSDIEDMIVYDEKKWHEYLPLPVDFVESPSSHSFGVDQGKLMDHLDFIINQLDRNGKMNPPWGKSFYQGDLKEAYHEWIGILTLKALVSLDKFQRIQ